MEQARVSSLPDRPDDTGRSSSTRQACVQRRRRAEHVHRLWLAAHSNPDPLRYSAHARLQPQLASIPVIEQEKGILMAQCGWSRDQAFDALRRLSQQENIKVRSLVAKLVGQHRASSICSVALTRSAATGVAAHERARHAQR